MVLATAEGSLPRPVLFHLNQAVLPDSLLQVFKLMAIVLTGLSLIPPPGWFQDEIGDLSAAVQAAALLMSKSAVVVCAVCIFFSALSAIRVAAPPEIHGISTEATQRAERANSSCFGASLLDQLPSPAWFPYLGIIASSMVLSDYVMTLVQILGSIWNQS